MLEVNSIITGLYATNTYLISDPVSGEAAVIDPAECDAAFLSFLKENGVRELKYILLTHGHFDHICGVYPLKKRLGGKILIHQEDALCLKDKRVSLASSVEGYEQIENENVQVFPGTVTNQNLEMIPLSELPGSRNKVEIFPTPPQNL